MTFIHLYVSFCSPHLLCNFIILVSLALYVESQNYVESVLIYGDYSVYWNVGTTVAYDKAQPWKIKLLIFDIYFLIFLSNSLKAYVPTSVSFPFHKQPQQLKLWIYSEKSKCFWRRCYTAWLLWGKPSSDYIYHVGYSFVLSGSLAKNYLVTAVPSFETSMLLYWWCNKSFNTVENLWNVHGSCVCLIIVGLYICLCPITFEVFRCFLGGNSTCNIVS
jgi:hypothetical protein